jgi:hypothetical protein
VPSLTTVPTPSLTTFRWVLAFFLFDFLGNDCRISSHKKRL